MFSIRFPLTHHFLLGAISKWKLPEFPAHGLYRKCVPESVLDSYRSYVCNIAVPLVGLEGPKYP